MSAAFQSSSVLAALEINFKSRLDQQDQEHSLSKVDYSLDGLAKLKQSQLTKPKPDQDFGSVKKSGKVKKKHLSVSWAVAHGDGDDGSEGDVISRDNLNSSDPSMDVDYKIPDSAAIFEAKKLRELKRNMKDLHRRDEEQQQRNNNNNNDEDELEELEPAAARELDFISLKSDAGVEGKKRGARGGGGGNIDEDEEDYNENTNIHAPRLISEDQEMEGLEAFEDNQDQNISFGAESIKNFDKRRKKEFEDNFKTV